MKKLMYYLGVICTSGFLFSCGEAEKTTSTSDSTAVDTVITNSAGKEKGIFAFNFSGLYFEADANNAGRISTFSLDGKNILSTKEVNATNWGTSLWPSPQSAWGWPPSKELDVKPYKVNFFEEGKLLELESEKDSLLGFVFRKNYMVQEDTSILVTYTISNGSDKKQ